jgi:hypothetical protein
MDAPLARDIRHALAEAMAEQGHAWTSLHDFAAGVALARVSLPTQADPTPAPVEETRADLERLRALATDLINQLSILTRDDIAYLWKIGGRPLDDAYLALKRELNK